MTNSLQSIFISYSSKDIGFATRLATDLKELGNGVWIDRAEIIVGDDLGNNIANAIEQTDFFCVILSHKSVLSKWVKYELRKAIETESKKSIKKILPIKIDDCKVPIFLGETAFADFITSYDDGLKSLLRNLNPGYYNGEDTLDKQMSQFYYLKAANVFNYEDNDKIVQEFLDKSLSFDSSNVEANFLQALILYDIGQILDSEKYFLKTILPETGLINKRSFNHLADIERTKGLRNAVKLLENSIPLGNSDFEAFYKLGEICRAVVIEAYFGKDYKKINSNEKSKLAFQHDCQNAQNFLRKALLLSSKHEDRANILFHIKEILDIYLPNEPAYSFAYLNEYILEVEKFSIPKIEAYFDLIWFFGNNFQFDLAKEYSGRLINKYPVRSDLIKKINDFLSERKTYKLMRFGDANILFTESFTFDSVRANMYNSKIEYYPSFQTQPTLITNEFTSPLGNLS